MSDVNNKKRRMANDGRNRTTKPRKIKILGEKETCKYLRVLEADTIKWFEIIGRIFKSISGERENYEMHKLLWDLQVKTDHMISARWQNLVIDNKKGTFLIENCTILADKRVKFKEGGKKDKYLDIAWELKKLWNMKVMVIPIVFDALGMIPKW